jgi:hypothetical protein
VSAMSAASNVTVMGIRKEADSLGEVDVPSAKLWGAQMQRSLEHFSIGHGKKEGVASFDPVRVISGESAGRNHAMDMREKFEFLIPGSKISLRWIGWLRIWGFNSITEAS